MAKNKTTETEHSVDDFIAAVKDETKRSDSKTLIALLKKETGLPPKMWGPSIVGFGSCHYKYESGREGDMPLVGFSPRSSALVLYLSGSFPEREELLQKLGKHKSDGGCIYIKKLADVDAAVLKKMVISHVQHIQEKYPSN